MNSKFSVVALANTDACFDLQFRKDTRHERTGFPTYYRWKIQFIITGPKERLKLLEKTKKELGCGGVTIAKDQARFAVQKTEDIIETIIPYFTRHSLGGGGLSQNKKKDFQLWQKAAAIIYQNKGVVMAKWKKNDLLHLMEIHKSMAKYKQKPRKSKWMEMAKTLTTK